MSGTPWYNRTMKHTIDSPDKLQPGDKLSFLPVVFMCVKDERHVFETKCGTVFSVDESTVLQWLGMDDEVEREQECVTPLTRLAMVFDKNKTPASDWVHVQGNYSSVACISESGKPHTAIQGATVMTAIYEEGNPVRLDGWLSADWIRTFAKPGDRVTISRGGK